MILLNNGSHFDIMIKKQGNERKLVVKLQFGRTSYSSEEIVLKPGPVDLRIKCMKNVFHFYTGRVPMSSPGYNAQCVSKTYNTVSFWICICRSYFFNFGKDVEHDITFADQFS